jgi:peptidyl-prolyl cis-trans isomerase SurA
MKIRLLLAFLPATSVAALGAMQPASTPGPLLPSGIVAVAEDNIITVADVMREAAPVLRGIQETTRNEQEYAEKVEGLYDSTIQGLADRVLIIKEFRKDDKRQIPASYVDNAIADELATRFEGDRSKQLAYLHSHGKTQRDYRRETEESIIYQYMQGQQRKSQSIVSPVRIETYYRENKDQFYQPDEIHLRIIQLNRVDGATDAALTEKAGTILARFRAGVPFEDLAREFSDTGRSKGGDWGWAEIGNLNPAFREAAAAMKQGEVSAPILLGDACYLVYAENRKYTGIKPIDEVRDHIERILISQMANADHERYLERLRRNGYVKFY